MIETLLTEYYDPQYQHHEQKKSIADYTSGHHVRGSCLVAATELTNKACIDAE